MEIFLDRVVWIWDPDPVNIKLDPANTYMYLHVRIFRVLKKILTWVLLSYWFHYWHMERELLKFKSDLWYTQISFLDISRSIYLSIYISICLSIYLFVHLSIYQSAYLSHPRSISFSLNSRTHTHTHTHTKKHI